MSNLVAEHEQGTHNSCSGNNVALNCSLLTLRIPIYLPGALFSAYSMVNTVTQLVGAVLFNLVYQATLGLTLQGSVFILCTALVLIPFALIR